MFEDIGDDTLWDKIRDKYYDIVPYNWRPKEIWYRFKCWAWYRYSTVKPRYLGHTWVDRDRLLIHTTFEILCQFYEKECGEDWQARDCPKNIVEVDGKEILVIDLVKGLVDFWHWYNKEVPDILHQMRVDYQQYSPNPLFKKYEGPNKTISHISNNDYGTPERKQKHDELLHKLWNYEKWLEDELDKNLHLIIKIRDSLWT